jgi:hypothetical protein
MAEAPEREAANAPPEELSELRRELTLERGRREAVDAENARLQAQIESYAEDLNSLYQERHGRGRGGLSAEVSSLRAELVDESAQREVLGELYQKSSHELRSLGDQLVTYGQDLAKAYKAGKKAGGDRPVSWRERASAAALFLGMLGTVAAGLILNPPDLGSTQEAPSPTVAPSPSAEVRLVSSVEQRPDFAAAAAAAAVSTASAGRVDEGATTATAVARQVGAAAGTATALAGRSASSAATAAAAGTALAASAGTATALAAGGPAASTPDAAVVAGPAATATAATGAARTAIAFAAEANATATVAISGAATALAVATQRAGTATAVASVGAAGFSAGAASSATAASGARATTATPTASPMGQPTPTSGPDLRPTVTALAGTIEQVSAESTKHAGTATVFAREASAVAVTATSFALTATAPTLTPTVASGARRGPPRPLGDLERCSWEVPIPPIGPGRAYYVQFVQSNRATVTVLWSHADGAMALSALAEGSAEDWRPVTPSARGDVVAGGLSPATYRVRLLNEGESASAETMIALFYDELAMCVEPTAYPDDAPAQPSAATVSQSASAEVTRPFLDCRPYVRAPFGFVQVHPRLWIDRTRRIEGTMPVTIKLTGPGTNLTLELVAGPGRRAERIPLTNFGRYQLEAIAEGADQHENCGQGFWFERTNPALPTLPAPPE